MKRNRRGMTLVELLVVIALMVVLMAILLPTVVTARRAALTARCGNHLKQLYVATKLYVDGASGKQQDIPAPGVVQFLWLDALKIYCDIERIRYCPAAPDASGADTNGYGSSSSGWDRSVYYSTSPPLAAAFPTAPTYQGSYGINLFTYAYHDSFFGDATAAYFPSTPVDYYDSVEGLNRRIAGMASLSQGGDNVPMFFDCLGEHAGPRDDDPVPSNFENMPASPTARDKYGMKAVCIARHGKFVNIVFCDGHVEKVPLGKLWTLKWSNFYNMSTAAKPIN